MSAPISAKDLPSIDGSKKYTVTGGYAAAIGFFIGMTVGQLGTFCGVFFSSLAKKEPAWWSFCFLGNAFQGIQGLTNGQWWPVVIERTADYFALVSLCGCPSRIPLAEVESVGVGEMRCCFKKVPCIDITITENFARQWGCGCLPMCRCRHIKFRIDEWEAFLADHGLSSSATSYGKATP